MKGHSSTPRPHEIPEASLRRLPIYYRFLQQMAIDKVTRVSCADIARGLGLDPTQVRKDIEMTGIVGKPRVGYPLADLVHWIENFLGWNRPKGAVLAGAGSLGSALLGYEQLNSHGMQIVAAFDIDPEKIGRQIQGRGVRPFAPLPAIVGRAAQSVTTPKVTRGIRAGGNSAPAHMPVPERVIPQNDDLLSLNRSTAMGKRNQLCRK